MALLAALAIFLALAAAQWAVAVALYRSTTRGPDPSTLPGYARVRAVAVGLVAFTSPAPFVVSFPAALLVWGFAAFTYLGLPPGRAAVLFCYLAAGAVVSRLVILGVLGLV